MLSKISILGCGWLGFSLAKSLLKNGHIVYGSTTTKEKLSDLQAVGIRPFLIDLPDNLEEEEVAAFFQADILILNIPPGRKQKDVVQHHLQQIEKVVELLRKGTVQKVVFVSSTGVYGDENKEVTELTNPQPTRGSTEALVLAEKFLQSQSHFQTTILRMGGLVGENRKAGGFMAGKKNVDNGDAPINMVHRDDCIGVIKEVLRQEKWGEIFNVCADAHPTRKEFYQAQARQLGVEPPTFTNNEEISYKIVSNEKVKTILKYDFIHPDPMKFHT